jgi:hypothetical protein
MKPNGISCLGLLIPILIGGSLATGALPTISASETIYVDINAGDYEDGSATYPFDSLQEGIEHASSGDTVLVAAGTYFEIVTIPHAKPGLLLKSQAGPELTVIDSLFQAAVITIQASVTIDGFTIRHGGGPNSQRDAGYGIAVNADGANAMLVHIRNNVIMENLGKGGIGINANVYPSDVSAIISRNQITRNSGVKGGGAGGISLNLVEGTPGSITIVNNLVYSNTGTTGGGLNLGVGAVSYGAIDVYNNTVYDNAASYGGGAVANSSPVNLTNNIFYGNSAGYEGNEFYLVQRGLSAQVANNIIGDGQYAGTNGNFADDPRFVSPGTGDFHLQRTSPAIDAGAVVPVDNDYEGDARPYDAPCGLLWDIGADEYYPAAGYDVSHRLGVNLTSHSTPPWIAGHYTIYLPLIVCMP